MFPEVMGVFKPRGNDSGIKQSSFFSPVRGISTETSKSGEKGREGMQGEVETGAEGVKRVKNIEITVAAESDRSDTSTVSRGCNNSVSERRQNANFADGLSQKCKSQGRTKRNADDATYLGIDDNVTSVDNIAPEKFDTAASTLAGNLTGEAALHSSVASPSHHQSMNSTTDMSKVDAGSTLAAEDHSSGSTTTGRTASAVAADDGPRVDAATEAASRSESPAQAASQQSSYLSTTDRVDGMPSAAETSTPIMPQTSSVILITDVLRAESSRTIVAATNASFPASAATSMKTDGGETDPSTSPGSSYTSTGSDVGTAFTAGTTDAVRLLSGPPALSPGDAQQGQTTAYTSVDSTAGVSGVQQFGVTSTGDTAQPLVAAAVVDSLDLTSSLPEETADVTHDVTSLPLRTTVDPTKLDTFDVADFLTKIVMSGQSEDELQLSPTSSHPVDVKGEGADGGTSSYELTTKPGSDSQSSSTLSLITLSDGVGGERSSDEFSDGTAASGYDQSSSPTPESSSLETTSPTAASTPTSMSTEVYILPDGLQPSDSNIVHSSLGPGHSSTSDLPTSSPGAETSRSKQTDKTGGTVDQPTEPDRSSPREEPTKDVDESDDRHDDGEQAELASESDIDWEFAKADWGYLWYGHLYALGALFGVLGLYVLVCIVSLGRMRPLFSRPYFASLNLLMLVQCATRSAYLLADGYNSNGTFYVALDYFLYSISFPCLTSAFGLQLFGLLEATNFQLLPASLQKISVLLTVVVLHFALTISTVAVLSTVADMTIMLFICQLFFVLWGLVLFLGFTFIFRKLLAHAEKRQKNMGKQTPHYKNGGEVSVEVTLPKFTLSVAVKVTLGTAVVGLLTVGLEIYGIVFVYNIFSHGRRQHWPWLTYHTLLRCAEFLMAASLCYVASLPFRRGHKSCHRCCCSCPVLCAPCAEICCCGADVAGGGRAGDGGDGSDCCQLRASADRRNGGDTAWGRRDKSWAEDPSASTPKTRICFSDEDHVVPFVTSPHASGTGEFATPLVGYPPASEGDDSKDGRYYSGCSLLPAAGYNGSDLTSELRQQGLCPDAYMRDEAGVLNTGYRTTAEDDDLLPSSLSKSRKSSLASSEFFHPPSSLSLAGSIASELDKAFRSLREESMLADLGAERGQDGEGECDASRELYGGLGEDSGERTGSTNPDSTLERFLLEQQTDEGLTGSAPLRRSRSAMGRSSFAEEDEKEQHQDTRKVALQDAGPWGQRLFRAGSDNIGGGGVRTKEVDSARYMSLLDIERNRGPVGAATFPEDEDEDERGRCEANDVRLQMDNACVAGHDNLASVRDDRALPAGREGRAVGGGSGSVGVAVSLSTPFFGNREVTRSLLTPIDYDSDDIEV